MKDHIDLLIILIVGLLLAFATFIGILAGWAWVACICAFLLLCVILILKYIE